MILNIISCDTQRNGVSGEPFLSILLRVEDDDNSPILLATIEPDQNDPDRGYDYRSCRVVNPFDLSDHYRGDSIGLAICKLFKEEGRPRTLTEKFLETQRFRWKFRGDAFPNLSDKEA